MTKVQLFVWYADAAIVEGWGWCWEIEPHGFAGSLKRYGYESERSARRAAKAWAKRHNMEVVE